MLGSVKRIGLLGGMSWESSAEYYRFVNEATRDRREALSRAADFVEDFMRERVRCDDARGSAKAENPAAKRPVDAHVEPHQHGAVGASLERL